MGLPAMETVGYSVSALMATHGGDTEVFVLESCSLRRRPWSSTMKFNNDLSTAGPAVTHEAQKFAGRF